MQIGILVVRRNPVEQDRHLQGRQAKKLWLLRGRDGQANRNPFD